MQILEEPHFGQAVRVQNDKRRALVVDIDDRQVTIAWLDKYGRVQECSFSRRSVFVIRDWKEGVTAGPKPGG